MKFSASRAENFDISVSYIRFSKFSILKCHTKHFKNSKIFEISTGIDLIENNTLCRPSAWTASSSVSSIIKPSPVERPSAPYKCELFFYFEKKNHNFFSKQVNYIHARSCRFVLVTVRYLISVTSSIVSRCESFFKLSILLN